jgi:hypothetical protein
MSTSSFPDATDAFAAPSSTVDHKIRSDLDTVSEKMDFCVSLLRPGGGSPDPSVRADETLLQLIGFLEACAPRMVELVEAAAQGALDEATLMQCLEVNDRLTKLMADIDTALLIESPATTTVAAAPTSEPTIDLDDLLLHDSTQEALPLSVPTAGLKSTGEDDPFAAFDKTPKPASSSTAPVLAPSNDEFDDFFTERTHSQQK